MEMEKEKYINGTVAVVGLGYVGLPLAVAFAEHMPTIGFDISAEKIELYKQGIDPTEEIGDEGVKATSVRFTSNPESLKEAQFIVVAVPTPVKLDCTPDLSPVEGASALVGAHMSHGSIVVFESTVWPGVTEDVCIPILEQTSGMVCGKDFRVAYSPERINPGDKVHRLATIKKIVSGMDDFTLDVVSEMYEKIIDVGVFRANSIKVAEAAKLAENAQRDINIAFMNELAIVFDKMNIRTKDVIEAMNTKWNALGFTPGLVGGHCIGVDPYYFIYKAELLGYHSQIIAAGRKINNSMDEFVASRLIKQMILAGKDVRDAKVYLFGLTFKENCPDIRNSRVVGIIQYLREYGIKVQVVDPWADKKIAFEEYSVELIDIKDVKSADALILCVPHKEFVSLSVEEINDMYNSEGKNVFFDVKSAFSKEQFKEYNFSYWSL